MSQLVLDDPQPVADCARSMIAATELEAPERFAARVVEALTPGDGEPITITTHAGCLICR